MSKVKATTNSADLDLQFLELKVLLKTSAYLLNLIVIVIFALMDKRMW